MSFVENSLAEGFWRDQTGVDMLEAVARYCAERVTVQQFVVVRIYTSSCQNFAAKVDTVGQVS